MAAAATVISTNPRRRFLPAVLIGDQVPTEEYQHNPDAKNPMKTLDAGVFDRKKEVLRALEYSPQEYIARPTSVKATLPASVRYYAGTGLFPDRP
jgi:hypothetical protein